MMMIELMIITPVHFVIYKFVPITLFELNFDDLIYKHVSFTAIVHISYYAYQLQPLKFFHFYLIFLWTENCKVLLNLSQTVACGF